MTASLTENSFHSARCHYKLNVSSTWWMDLSAKIYFDQVSAPFSVTLWLSPFLSSFLSSFHLSFFPSLSFRWETLPHGLRFYLSCSRQAWCLAVICEPRPWAMCFRVSMCVHATLILAWFSQTAKQSDWLELCRVTWDKENIRRVILADQTATLLQGPSYELWYTDCHAWEDRSSKGDGLTSRSTWGHTAITCCKKRKRKREKEKLIERNHVMKWVLAECDWCQTCLHSKNSEFTWSFDGVKNCQASRTGRMCSIDT